MTLQAFIVEDSPVIRDNLIATLEEMLPMRVVGHAEDEATAVRWLRTHPGACDLVVVDIFLRSGSGMGVLSTLHQDRSDCTRIVLSNYATEDMQRRCLSLGATRVFDKSHDIEALIDFCANLASATPS